MSSSVLDQGTIYWPTFCGNSSSEYDAFWSFELSINASTPDITECFGHSVLTWFPCGFFWFAMLGYIPHLIGRERTTTFCNWSILNAVKVLSGLVCSVCTAILVMFVYESANATPAAISAWSIKLATMVMWTWIHRWEFWKGVHTSGVMFGSTFLLLICELLPMRSYIVNYMHLLPQDRFISEKEFIVYCVYLAFVFVQFVCNLFSDLKALGVDPFDDTYADKHFRTTERQPLLANGSAKADEPAGPQPSPELTIPFWTKISFIWLTKAVFKGFWKTVTFENLYDIRPVDKCKALVPDFYKYYFGLEEDTPYTEDEVSQMTGLKPKRTFFRSLMRSCGWQLIYGLILHSLAITLRILQPQVLSLLIRYVEAGDVRTWKGVFLAIVLLVTCVLSSLCMHNFMHVCWQVGMQVRTIINAVVYRKAMRLSGAARKNTTVGEIVNLMSVDSQKLQDAFIYAPMLWEVLATLAPVLYFMWASVGPASMAGMGVILVMFPLNGILLANQVRKLQARQMIGKDGRLKMMNEILAGIKILKLYAWEPSFIKNVLEKREIELSALKMANILTSLSNLGLYMCPYLISLAIFSTYVLSSPYNVLDADKAFVTRAYISTLNFIVSMLPLSVSFLGQGLVSTKRINAYLSMEELKEDYVEKKSFSMKDSVRIENGTFSWDESEEQPALENIDMSVRTGQLVAVVGHVGAGKTSLISAILGEMDKITGRVMIKGDVAYVPQQAWIQNATVRDNILFGRHHNKRKYDQVLEACALTQDLKILDGGDLTEIGEKGINLSGGQKQRVSIARAVFQDEDIYLLDDPLSAVDAHVGRHIFDNVFGPRGLLRNKTRILVTHSMTYLPQTDLIVVLEDGNISEIGSYEELLAQDGAFADFLRSYLTEQANRSSDDVVDIESDSEDVVVVEPTTVPGRYRYLRSRSWTPFGRPGLSPAPAAASRALTPGYFLKPDSYNRSLSRGSSGSGYFQDYLDVDPRESPLCINVPVLDLSVRRGSTQRSLTKSHQREETLREVHTLVEVETTEVGLVKWSVIGTFLSAAGWPMFACLIVFHTLYTVGQIVTNLWLSAWTTDALTNSTYQAPSQTHFRLGIYGALGFGQATFVMFVMLSAALGCIAASRNLHWNLLNRIIHSPMSFFDTTPLGRIMNRFSKDLDALDTNIPLFLRGWLFCASLIVSSIFIISYTTPIFLIAVVPIGLLFVFAQRVYNTYMGQMKRLDSIKRSPIYAHFDESITGASSIRAYRRQRDFINKCDTLIDYSQRPWYHILVAQRWSGFLMETLGALVVFFAALFSVLNRFSLTPGLVGLSISFGLQVITLLNTLIRCAAEMETHMVSVERMDEYCHIEQEAPWKIPGMEPERDWPKDGSISFHDYSTRYRAGLDLVLKELTFSIKPGEMVGIVGRTGAGKSSIALALFRIVEAAQGSIIIDGTRIHTLGLHDVRSRVTVIPQDPVVFSGTLRFNLDPFSTYSDAEIWEALSHAHLKAYVEQLEKGLQHDCGEGGEGLSVGQRQLVCLARALLRKSQILVLDEATAAIDLETDALIQETIRTQFRDCTVLTVAHRLNTILDYDRIMVLDRGKVKEFDTPHALLNDKRGVFYGMAKEAGLVSSY